MIAVHSACYMTTIAAIIPNSHTATWTTIIPLSYATAIAAIIPVSDAPTIAPIIQALSAIRELVRNGGVSNSPFSLVSLVNR
jgi:hypothetical protein